MKHIALIGLMFLVGCGDEVIVRVDSLTFWGWAHLHAFWAFWAFFLMVLGVASCVNYISQAVARSIGGPSPHVHIQILHDGQETITLNLPQEELRAILSGLDSVNTTPDPETPE